MAQRMRGDIAIEAGEGDSLRKPVFTDCTGHEGQDVNAPQYSPCFVQPTPHSLTLVLPRSLRVIGKYLI
jgi:hypothetical protein